MARLEALEQLLVLRGVLAFGELDLETRKVKEKHYAKDEMIPAGDD